MIQTALWLPRDMHERLKKAGGQRGMGEEIRALLEQAMQEADAARSPDEITDEVLHQIKDIAGNLSHDGPLWANRAAFEVFKVAVNGLLDGHQPPTEATPEAWAKLKAIYGDDRPEVIGRILARHTVYAYARERDGAGFPEKLKPLDKLKRGE